jgi:hypothetical protein
MLRWKYWFCLECRTELLSKNGKLYFWLKPTRAVLRPEQLKYCLPETQAIEKSYGQWYIWSVILVIFAKKIGVFLKINTMIKAIKMYRCFESKKPNFLRLFWRNISQHRSLVWKKKIIVLPFGNFITTNRQNWKTVSDWGKNF